MGYIERIDENQNRVPQPILKILVIAECAYLLNNPYFSFVIKGYWGYTHPDGALTVPFTLCKLVGKHRVKFNTFLPFHAGLSYNAARIPDDAKR